MDDPTPLVPPPNRIAHGLLLGTAISLACFSVIGLIGGAVAFSAVEKAKNDARKGWNLVPIVVAAVDISENTVVAMEMISQRSVPEQFVTSSVVKPAERLSNNIDPAERVVSIKASGEPGVGGWIRPDDRVDVIVVFPPLTRKSSTR